ncbi:hypothetical protein RB653_004279 [Dictyostelium firmibasis]|uniref:U3 small nucleolar ribonucleoprotein protein MPP10 n=1 Tax=Dictyostelium firmibasis TaxID=79012 RepID=A0AAN7YS85_9MYCE
MAQISKKKINNNNNNNNNNNKKNEKPTTIVEEDKSDKGVLNKVDSFMNKVYDTPEVFVGSTDKIKNSMTDIMSNLYELAKKNESTITETDALDSLVTKGFDGEQIWAQLQLYNDPILQELESKVNDLTTSNDLNIIQEQEEDFDDDEDFDGDEEDDEDFNLEHDDYQESDLEDELSPQEDSLGDSDIESEEEEEDVKPAKSNKNNKKTTVNDKDDNKKIKKDNKKNNFFGDDEKVDFFDAKEMEKFLDDEDDNEYQRREDEEENDDDDVELGDSDEEDGGLDLPEVEMDDEEKHLDSLLDKYMEENADELEQERLASKSKSKSKPSSKKSKLIDPSNMKFDDFFSNPNENREDDEDDEFPVDNLSDEDDYQDEDENENEDEDEDNYQDEDEESDEEDEEKEEEEIKEDKDEATLPPEELSSFQKRAQRIQQRIKELEQQNLKKKDWTLVGESSAKDRPSDSLLGEVLDYDHTQRATPTITEETNKTIDDMIKKRILEKNFDDVIRKTEKEFKDNYKKKVELSDEKSTEGLGEVYEKNYMKQVLGVEETDELKQKHIKIYELFNKLCYKLDSLANFQFTPKRIKNKDLNITTANALTIEEKIPVATSSATMIAPEEVYFKKNADEKGESELTKEERVKNRKKVKQQWKNEKDEKEAEIRHKKKVDPSFANKTTVAADMAHLQQSSNVTIFDSKKSDVHSGDFRSGKTFATIQQKEDNKRKGIDDPNSLKSKKKAKLDSIKSSDFKL